MFSTVKQGVMLCRLIAIERHARVSIFYMYYQAVGVFGDLVFRLKALRPDRLADLAD